MQLVAAAYGDQKPQADVEVTLMTNVSVPVPFALVALIFTALT